MQKGEITAFLSLIFILLVSFTGAVMESASIQNAKNYRRADTNRAMECMFAEYQKELLEKYDIFALEGSYESGTYTEEQVLRRLDYYGGSNMEHKISKIEFLTDQNGQVFFRQAVRYMEHRYGIHLLNDKVSMTDTWKVHRERAKEYEKEEKKSREELDGLLQESESSLPAEDNPIEHVAQLKKKSLIDLVVPEEMDISDKAIPAQSVPSNRKNNCGYGEFSQESQSGGTMAKLLFDEYLLEHFSAATDEKKEGVLDYELEYILNKKNSDRENLEETAKKLFLFRFASNYSYLQKSSKKKAEAEALALTLCTLAAVPGLEKAAMQMILLAWTFGESIVDIRVLLNRKKVPLVKDDESWQLSLGGLMQMGEETEKRDGQDAEKGMDYREYLRALLFLQKKEELSIRALDLIEMNIRKACGADFFRADYCITKAEIKSSAVLRRGITYRFQTYYGYR